MKLTLNQALKDIAILGKTDCDKHVANRGVKFYFLIL